MKICYVQFAPRYLDVEYNLSSVERLLAAVDAELVVLPELFTSGYFFRSAQDLAQVAEPLPGGKTTERLHTWANDLDATLVAGVAERDGDIFYNSAAVVSPMGYEGTYRKVHLYYKEKTLFAPGDEGFAVYQIERRNGIPYTLGVMICFDWYFPEAARSLVVQGADIIAHPSNLVRPDCPRSMPIRALENHVYTVTANRHGSETCGDETLTFIGQSEVCDPNGQILVRADQTGDHVGVVDIDPFSARDRKITAYNHILDDRRPRLYVGG
jgi:predicted amidohydrolase